MRPRQTISRRHFLKGAAATASVGALAACNLQTLLPTRAPATVVVATQEPATATPTTVSPIATPTAVPPTAVPTSAPATLKYGDRACIHRHILGGYAQAGSEAHLIKDIQEEALRQEYGINVDIQFESASWDRIEQLMELQLQAQGADSAQSHPQQVQSWLSAPDLVRDIEGLLQEYGPNLLKKVPHAGWMYVSRDGKYAGIPAMRSTPCDVEYMFIRYDWLDRIDRPVPATFEELEECLRLFKERKLGGEATIPFTLESGWWMVWECMQGPWTPDPDEQFRMMERGESFEPQYGAMQPERLEMIRRWYRDGLLNPEYAPWSPEDEASAVKRGVVGAITGGWWLLDGILRDAEQADPQQNWVFIYPPLGLAGQPAKGRIITGGAVERTLVFTSWTSCPEALIALADWQNKAFDNWMLCSHGIEGRHWQYGEGGWFESLLSEPPVQEYSGIRSATWTAEMQTREWLLPPRPGSEPKDPNLLARVLKSCHTRQQSHIPERGEFPTVNYIDHYVPYRFPESAHLTGDLDMLRDEYMGRIIRGELEPVAGVQAFWDAWMAAGGEMRMRELTDQYHAWLAENPDFADPKAFLDPDSWDVESDYSYAERRSA